MTHGKDRCLSGLLLLTLSGMRMNAVRFSGQGAAGGPGRKEPPKNIIFRAAVDRKDGAVYNHNEN